MQDHLEMKDKTKTQLETHAQQKQQKSRQVHWQRYKVDLSTTEQVLNSVSKRHSLL
ncbi:peptide synthetase [Sesbania bispinosa]|nr:peptide synthetase [Sesbania bispinosa]